MRIFDHSIKARDFYNEIMSIDAIEPDHLDMFDAIFRKLGKHATPDDRYDFRQILDLNRILATAYRVAGDNKKVNKLMKQNRVIEIIYGGWRDYHPDEWDFAGEVGRAMPEVFTTILPLSKLEKPLRLGLEVAGDAGVSYAKNYGETGSVKEATKAAAVGAVSGQLGGATNAGVKKGMKAKNVGFDELKPDKYPAMKPNALYSTPNSRTGFAGVKAPAETDMLSPKTNVKPNELISTPESYGVKINEDKVRDASTNILGFGFGESVEEASKAGWNNITTPDVSSSITSTPSTSISPVAPMAESTQQKKPRTGYWVADKLMDNFEW